MFTARARDDYPRKYKYNTVKKGMEGKAEVGGVSAGVEKDIKCALKTEDWFVIGRYTRDLTVDSNYYVDTGSGIASTADDRRERGNREERREDGWWAN